MTEFPLTLEGQQVREILDGRLTSLALRAMLGDHGSRVWVRETWAVGHLDHPKFIYAADGHSLSRARGGRWLPPEHMPRRASRLLLEVIEKARGEGGLWHYEFKVLGRVACHT